MGWAWRSADKYGDKDAAHEPELTDKDRSASQPAAESDKTRKSLWDDEINYDDWRGYQGPTYGGYSYSGAFDDSDDRWYRRNKFKYSGYKDYSPSSLFRSAFYTPKYGLDSEIDLKNKAIRALRSLTRNANTVCDKDKKINYVIQYTGGADVNNADTTLVDGQESRVIYVSPDEIIKADTDTEKHDAAVDALTGFVLLRVQIAQEFNPATIQQINAMTLSASPYQLVQDMVTAGKIVSAADTAANYINRAMAAIVAKGALTRLARRNVVTDWGGFAPYIARHTKKFATVREKLEAAEFSLEKLVGQIAYNLIDDENNFELPPDIDAIVAKHLGASVEEANLIPVSLALVEELRQHLLSSSSECQGDIEKKFEKIVQKIMDEFKRENEEKQRLTDAHTAALDKFGEAVEDYTLEALKFRSEFAPSINEAGEILNEMQNAIITDDFRGLMNTRLESVKTALDKVKSEPNVDTPTAKGEIENINLETDRARQTLLCYKTSLDRLIKSGVCADPAEAIKDIHRMVPRDEVPKITEEAIEKWSKIMEQIKDHIKATTAVLKERAIANIDKRTELMRAATKQAATTSIAKGDLGRDLAKIYKEAGFGGSRNSHKSTLAVEATAETLSSIANSKIRDAETTITSTSPNAINDIKARHAIRTIAEKYANYFHTASNLTDGLTAGNTGPADPFNTGMTSIRSSTSASTKAINEFVQTAKLKSLDAAHKTGGKDVEASKVELRDVTNWKPEAIKEFLKEYNKDKNGSSPAGAGLAALLRMMPGMLDKIQKAGLLTDPADPKSRMVPRDPEDFGSEEDLKNSPQSETAKAKKRLENMANSLGLDLETLLTAYANAMAGSDSSATAVQQGEEIAQKIRKLLPLFDELDPSDGQLFGEKPVEADDTNIKKLGNVNTINDEARNDPEEEYVAYLGIGDADSVKPAVKIVKPRISARAKILADTIRNRSCAIIQRVREALQFQNNKRTGEIFGVRSGDLDEGGLHKLDYDCEHIWSQKTLTKMPDVAVGILVDQSGSMHGRDKIGQAREICIILAEAIKQIKGVHLHVYGHTANEQGLIDLTIFEHYTSNSDTATATADLSGLGAIDAYSNNYDGYAIKEAAKLLAKDPAKRKYLFVLSDGLPHGEGYGGDPAKKHVASVCEFVRNRLKIGTYAFAIGVDATYRGQFTRQYGKNNVMFMTNVRDCLPQIVRFIRNSLQKEKKLIDVTE